MTKEVNTVVCAMRKGEFGSVVGYFATVTEVPKDWKVCDTDYDITDVMRANRWSREQALRVMNHHWRRS